MRVTWSKDAKTVLRDTADYLQTEFDGYARRCFLQEAHKTAKLLENSPYMGKVEPLLATVSNVYRGIVVGRLNKLIYYVDSDHDVVEIVDLWDTRREPQQQANHLFS